MARIPGKRTRKSAKPRRTTARSQPERTGKALKPARRAKSQSLPLAVASGRLRESDTHATKRRTPPANARAAPRPSRLTVKVQRLAHAEGLALPAYQTKFAAGMDLIAAIDAKKPIKLKRGAHVLIPTGLVLQLPPGTEAQVRPRSGLAIKHGITVLNAPGTIDADYRGEVGVILVNHGTKTFTITRGERIAQLVVARVEQAALVEVKSVAATERGTGGFGSTGRKTRKA